METGFPELAPPPLGSDGQCTGIPEGIGPFDWSDCCLTHDGGGRDGVFYDCMVDHTPGTPEWVLALMLLGLIILKPIYNLGQRWRVWK